MNHTEKIKQQASELNDARVNVVHYGEMVKLAIQALQYIATGGKNMQPEESKILLLNQAGIPVPQHEVTPPFVVAAECLDIIRAMNEKHMKGLSPGAAYQKQKIDEVRLIDGESIFFTTDFDVLHHSCCSCQQVHAVELVWSERDGKPVLETKWTRLDSAPTLEELQSKGEVVSLSEVKQ